MSTPITEDEFRLIKSKLLMADALSVSYIVGRHLAIVTKVGACKTFADYERIKKAEHPPVKNSLADRVADLERRVHALEAIAAGF